MKEENLTSPINRGILNDFSKVIDIAQKLIDIAQKLIEKIDILMILLMSPQIIHNSSTHHIPWKRKPD